MFNILVLGLICIMAFDTANTAYSSSSGRRAHRYAPQYDYGGGGYAGAGSFAGVGSDAFDPFSFVFGHQNAVLGQIGQTHANNLAFQDQLTKSILAQNAYLANQARGGGHSYGHRRRPVYSSYSGGSVSVGPNGVHHVTFVHPPNHGSPNVDTRFGGSHRGSGGFGGIASSSYSTNVNGKHHGGSATIVNDNGKVTGYRTHS